MKKVTIVTTLLLAGGMGSPAFAQEADPDFFNGLYVGGVLAADTLPNDSEDTLIFDTDRDGSFDERVRTVAGRNAFSPGFCGGRAGGAREVSGCGSDSDDLGYAIRVGYDQRLGNNGPFVAGLLVEGAMSDSRDFTTGFSTTPASYTFSRELDYSVALRGRLGYSPGEGRGLFYVTGGLAYGRIEHDFTTTNGANSFTGTNDDDMQLGGQIGGGAELMITDNFGIGMEYLYSRYEDDDYFVAVGPGSAGPTNPFLLNGGGTNIGTSDSDLDIHSLRATASFHF